MTVLSVLAGKPEGFRHPLDLAQCVRTSRPAPEGTKVCVRIHRVQTCLASQVSKHGAQDALAFIFCAGRPATISSHTQTKTQVDADEEEAECRHVKALRFDSVGGVQLPPFELANIGLLSPVLLAAHGGLLSPAGAMCACLPIMAPFQVPQVSPDSWMANKRAVAFHRCCTLAVYTQGALAIGKFAGGDLVGGTYLGLQAALGAYAITPDGTRLMPSYLMISAFNGVLGLVQVFQQFQGVPLMHIPPTAIMAPTISLLACYWVWQFTKELRAIGGGLVGDGPQDTCWVNFMGGDIWPITLLSPTIETRERDRAGGESVIGGGGGVSNRFSAFAGGGHRLGEN